MESLRKLCTLVSLVAGLASSYSAFAQTQQSVSAASTQNRALITLPAAQSNNAAGRTIKLQFPAGTRTESVKAVLNGKDVSDSFHQAACSGSAGVCLSAVLTENDGLRDSKNVLYATAKNQNGTASSSRIRFPGAQPTQPPKGLRTLSLSKSSVTAADTGLPTASSFLPPTVAFTTLSYGGATPESNWVQIGTLENLPTGSCGTQIYSVIIVDRQTLEQKTSAPESSPQCFASSSALNSYLAGLAQASPKLNDIVIVGTNQGYNTDAGSATGAFSTYYIGGRTYNCGSGCTPGDGGVGTADVPDGYMAIGVLGAESGSAFENYTDSRNNEASAHAHATGMLVEDASGNYNFQPSGNVEFMVQPGQTAAQASVTINNAPSAPGYSVVYSPPTIASNATGFWLLVLDRNTLATAPGCAQGSTSNGVILVPNCGTFVATGGAQGSPGNMAQLAGLLNNVTDVQIAILTTVGTAGWGPPNVMAGTGASYGSDNGSAANGVALQRFGIPDKLILETGATNSTFTMVGVPGLGGPLNGHNVLSTNYLSRQGQTGYVHGTFALDNHGLFEPSHTQQEQGLDFGTGTTTDNANLQLGLIMSQQPVEWPEFASPLNGSVDLPGQIDAYKYMSFYLLNNWYFIGQLGQDGAEYAVQPPLAYDMHYFFTGSLNTWIDIHTFDPWNAKFPTSNCGSTPNCVWIGPDGTVLNFTVADFYAVTAQLHNEVADLTNVLNYFVSGSTNLKDVVASGNSNAALALLQGFSTVEANINEQAVALVTTTPVKVSPWHIVNMILGDIGPAVAFATDGAVTAANVKTADKAIGVIADMIHYASSMDGGLSSGNQSNTADIPRLDYSLDTTVGQFAGLALQGQFLAGFDATLDSITGDWNKLNAIGSPSITTQSLYSPTQAAQNTAILQITTAEQKSLYMSLIPAVFQVHYWNMTSGASTLPDLGYTSSGDANSCNIFYPGIVTPPTGTTAPSVAITYPTYGGTSYLQYWYGGGNGYPFRYSADPQYQDWYVFSLPFLNVGHSDASAQVMDSALQGVLFGNAPDEVNFSMDEFVAIAGPMDQPVTGASSSLLNFDTVYPTQKGLSPDTNLIGISPGNICSASEVGLKSAQGSSNPNATTTTLQAPSSALLGDSVTLVAKVVVTATSAPAGGSVQFRDGSTALSTVPLDSTGSATVTVNTLALGQHSLVASFASTDGSSPSNSTAQAITIYAENPDVTLSLSTSTLTVKSGTPSSAVQLQAASQYGLAGTLQFACVGLPLGMTCNFNPAQATISSGGTATTSFTINTASTAASSFVPQRFWPIFLALQLILLACIGTGRRRLRKYLLFLLLLTVSVGGAVGCGGSSSKLQTGTMTVLISASSGSLTRTTPLTVTIQ